MFTHLWVMIECAIDRLSVEKTAVIGGSGSVVSAGAASIPDFTAVNAWADVVIKMGSASGVLLSIGLMGFKGWLMWRHRHKPPS